jgi:soluble cytochrome b562
MRISHLILAALLALPLPFLMRAEQPKQPQEETALEEKMDVMGAAFRKLKRQVGDAAQNAASLKLVAAMRTAAEEAVKLAPAKAADVPEAERPRFVADYRAKMSDLLVALEKLSQALQANNNDQAVRLVSEIGVMQKVGHKVFKRPDEKS